MKKYIHLLTASILLASLTACSQQQVQTTSAATTKDTSHCRGCNAPKVEPVIKKPTPRPVVAKSSSRIAPKPRIAYQPRQHIPTIPNKKNASSSLVQDIQNALHAKGYNPGSTDGVMGARTSSALSAFQNANRLPTGINQPTLKALGIR